MSKSATCSGAIYVPLEASGEPDDFHREISADHGAALLRAQLDTDRFSETEPLVEALQTVVDDWSATHGLEAVVSGRVAVSDGWMSRLAEKHFQGLGLACLLMFLASWAAFRSWRSDALAMVPVLVGVLFVYAAMGVLSIDIAPATSMTAAIATGLGIDFAIYLISHVRARLAEGAALTDAFDGEYRRIVMACIWCAVSLALMVICLSSAPPLRWFGALVAAGAIGSLIGSLFLVPALLALGRPTAQQGEVVHGEDKAATRTLFHFNKPAGISGTAFLTENRKVGADEAWLFLPATDRVRRLPASDRGDSFLGADLSYGDIKDNFRFPLDDWRFEARARKPHRGKPHRTLSGNAASADAAREMGYGSFAALVDPDTLLPMRIDFTDPEGAPRKRVEVLEAGQVDGVLTALRFTMTDARSGHMTEMRFEGLRALAALPRRWSGRSCLRAIGVSCGPASRRRVARSRCRG